jgi:hypothetical protein
MHKNGANTIGQEELKILVPKSFSELYVRDFGWHKIVFGIRACDEKIVLKVAAKRVIENDHRAYKRVPENMRHRLFARIFWHTKYCLLQEYGFPTHVTAEQLATIRQVVYRYGIFDIKAENLKRIGGELKIIDANVTRVPVPFLLRKIDEWKPKMPKRLVRFIKKTTRPFYEK